MDWFQSKTGQLIALATIVTTLAGFGYSGATYVNRIANLEAKIGGIGETESEMKVIEERFASIETSVQFLDSNFEHCRSKLYTSYPNEINQSEWRSCMSKNTQ